MVRLPSSLCRAIAAALFALAIMFPSAAFGAEKGIDTDMTWGTSNTTQTRTADAMADTGAKWTRLTISWADVESSKGSYNSSKLSATDNAVNLSLARGVKVLMMVNEAPSWASGRSDKNSPPANPADYARFVNAMAARYRGKVSAWEIWNEQNFVRFWSTGPNPAAYAQLLKAAYPAVKSGDPNAQVVYGGLQFNDYAFIEASYNEVPNLGDYYDVMATHPYPPAGGSPELTHRDSENRIYGQSFNGYRRVHDLMLQYGDDKPIWFTEFGWATYPQSGGVDEATQARYTKLAYECIEPDSYVQIAFLYNLRNNWWSNDSLDWESQLGLMRTDFSKKPAYDVYKGYSAGGASECTYREGDGTPTPAGSGPLAPKAPASTTTQPTTTTTTTTSAPAPARTTVSRTRTTLRVQMRRPGASSKLLKSAAVPRFRVTVLGRVIGADAGRVTIELQRRVGGKWRKATTRSTAVSRLGDFKRALLSKGSGRWRIRAVYGGTRTKAPSKSSFVGFRI